MSEFSWDNMIGFDIGLAPSRWGYGAYAVVAEGANGPKLVVQVTYETIYDPSLGKRGSFTGTAETTEFTCQGLVAAVAEAGQIPADGVRDFIDRFDLHSLYHGYAMTLGPSALKLTLAEAIGLESSMFATDEPAAMYGMTADQAWQAVWTWVKNRYQHRLIIGNKYFHGDFHTEFGGDYSAVYSAVTRVFGDPTCIIESAVIQLPGHIAEFGGMEVSLISDEYVTNSAVCELFRKSLSYSTYTNPGHITFAVQSLAKHPFLWSRGSLVGAEWSIVPISAEPLIDLAIDQIRPGEWVARVDRVGQLTLAYKVGDDRWMVGDTEGSWKLLPCEGCEDD